jgi:hypothetical protein
MKKRVDPVDEVAEPADQTAIDASLKEVEEQKAKELAAYQATLAPVTQDFSQYDKATGLLAESRSSLADAVRLQKEAAEGRAPSQAEALGRLQMDRAFRDSMAMAASSRGGSLAQGAAMRAAQMQYGTASVDAANQAMAARAAEMAQARGAYAAGALGMGQQDLGLAQMGLSRVGAETANAQYWRNLAQQERALIQQGKLGQAGIDAQVMMNNARIASAERQAQIAQETAIWGGILQSIGAAGAAFVGKK